MLFDVEVFTLLLKGVIGKLPTVVRNDDLAYTKMVENVFPKELLDRLAGNSRQGLNFNPFGKVVNSHYQESVISRGPEKITNNVHPLLLERSRGRNRDHEIDRLVMFGSMMLARRTTKDQHLSVLSDCGPKLFE